jgi:hypothetical protein
MIWNKKLIFCIIIGFICLTTGSCSNNISTIYINNYIVNYDNGNVKFSYYNETHFEITVTVHTIIKYIIGENRDLGWTWLRFTIG